MAEKKQLAAEKSVVNYGFFIGATPENLEEINSVNTYRIIFNHIFNSNYDYLETYNFQINENGELIDITEKLKSFVYAP